MKPAMNGIDCYIGMPAFMIIPESIQDICRRLGIPEEPRRVAGHLASIRQRFEDSDLERASFGM